jgi:hypothetical protein
MFRLILAVSAATLLAPPLWAAPAPAVAAKTAFDLPIPGKSLVVMQLQGHLRVREQAKAMLRKALPDLAPALNAKIDSLESMLPAEMSLKSVRPDDRIGLAFLSVEGAEPEFVVLLPMKDVAAFRSELLPPAIRKTYEKGRRFDTFEPSDGKTAYVVDLTKDGYIGIGSSQEAAEALANSTGRLQPSTMGQGAAELFFSSDIGVYVHMERINELYGESIRQFRQLFQTIMMAGGPAAGTVSPQQLETIRTVYDRLFQAVEDSQGLALGLNIRAEGIGWKMGMAFAPDTTTRKALAGEQPTALTQLRELPAGLGSYSAGKLGDSLGASLASFSVEFTAADDADDRAIKAFQAYAELAASSRQFLVAGSSPTQLIVQIPKDAKATAAAKFLAFELMAAGGRYNSIPLKAKPKFGDVLMVAGYKLQEVSLQFDFEEAVKYLPAGPAREAAETAMKKFAPEKIRLWFGTDGKQVLTVTAKDADAAKAQVEAFLKPKTPIQSVAAFQEIVRQLPQESTIISLTDVGQAMGGLTGSLKEMLGSLPIPGLSDLPDLKPAPKLTTYFGLAVTARPGDVQLELFIPTDAVIIAREVFSPLIEYGMKKAQEKE